jgi:ketosteroid isomerase-like protein
MSDKRLRELLDKQELYELVIRAAHAVDRADTELLLSCYHPDGFDDHGSFRGGPREFAEFLQNGTLNPEVQAGPVQHSITNAVFEIDGDVAYGHSYCDLRRTLPNGTIQRDLGRYVDRFERRDGVWKLAHRRVISESPAHGYDTSMFIPSQRNRTDISYERRPAAVRS